VVVCGMVWEHVHSGLMVWRLVNLSPHHRTTKNLCRAPAKPKKEKKVVGWFKFDVMLYIS